MNRQQLEGLKERLLQVEGLDGDPDAGAIVSHFLQRPHECPPRLARQTFNKLKKVANNEIATALGRVSDDGAQLLNQIVLGEVPFPPPQDPQFKFIDLFAGIGGFRIAFQDAGGECVFTSEWDRFAKQTYERNFGEVPFGDITRIKEHEIPEHDVLCAGFPCQPFSLGMSLGSLKQWQLDEVF